MCCNWLIIITAALVGISNGYFQKILYALCLAFIVEIKLANGRTGSSKLLDGESGCTRLARVKRDDRLKRGDGVEAWWGRVREIASDAKDGVQAEHHHGEEFGDPKALREHEERKPRGELPRRYAEPRK